MGLGNEVKVKVDPLTITLSGPLGKFVIPITATLGSVRSIKKVIDEGTIGQKLRKDLDSRD